MDYRIICIILLLIVLIIYEIFDRAEKKKRIKVKKPIKRTVRDIDKVIFNGRSKIYHEMNSIFRKTLLEPNKDGFVARIVSRENAIKLGGRPAKSTFKK